MEKRHQEAGKISILGICLNVLLASCKLAAGFFTGSMSMVADGFNNTGDAFSSIMTMIGNHLASMPCDDEHPYGHGKAEYIFSMVISMFMLFVSYQMFTNALNSFINGKTFEFSVWLVAVSLISAATKWMLYYHSCRLANKQNNLMLKAMAEDSRNDILISFSVVIGSICAEYQVFWVDSAVSILISVWIAYTGLKIFAGAYNVLMDTSINRSFKEQLAHEISCVQGVDHVDSITAKPVGVSYIIIVKASVCGTMSVSEGHIIAGIIKNKVAQLKGVADVVVHINPV